MTALTLLACLLTVAASGDDFCLPRVIFPTATTAQLPLDDPNTDFLTATDSCAAFRSALDGGGDTVLAGPGPSSSSPAAQAHHSPLDAARLADARLAPAALNSPLHC
jgi:hypothetical protein